jgi:hypothetical protein
MKVAAIHDADGRIQSLVVRPPDAPEAAVSTVTGQRVTDVEPPDAALDLTDAESLQRLAEKLQQYRVQRHGATARLVRHE